MKNENYEKCTTYFEERVFGILSYFEAGYMTVTAYAVFDMLRFITIYEPLCFFDERIVRFSKTVGVKLPASLEDLSFWKDRYLNIYSISEDIKATYNKTHQPKV